MRIGILAGVMLLAASGTAAAQSNRVYFGGTFGANGGSRGPVDVGSVVTAGGLAGVRLGGGWSVEFEVDRGFASSERHDPETFWLSYAPPGSSNAEIDRLGVRARFDRTDRAREGYSAHLVWKTREPGRVNAAVYGGVSWRNFTKRTVRTITFVPDDPAIGPDNPNVRDADETSSLQGGGLSAGMMVPIRLTRALTLAPDFRFTLGLITDESTYKIFSTSVRVMWGF